MKEGWTYKKLGEVCDYSIGLTYKPTDVCDNGTIVLRSSNIQNGQIDLNDIVRVSCPIKDSLFVNKGDILMCSRNGSARLVGKVAIIPDIKERMTYGTFMMIIRSDYNPFLFYYFNSDIFRKQIKHGEANMINQITRYMLDDVVVSLPPLSDQQRIVSRLDAAFSHIDELKANAEKQLSEARALFQKSLAKAIEPKEGWKESSFKDVFDDITDFVAAGSFADLRKNVIYNDKPDYAQLVRTTDIKHGFKNDSFVYINEHAFKYLWRVNLDEECIILPNVGVNCGEVYYLNPENLPYKKNVLGPNAILVRSHSLNNIFMSYYLKGFAFQVQLRHITSSMAQPKYNKTNLKLLTVCFPPLSEQQRIVERLDALSAHVRELEENQKKIISECDALKQALLRKVFE